MKLISKVVSVILAFTLCLSIFCPIGLAKVVADESDARAVVKFDSGSLTDSSSTIDIPVRFSFADASVLVNAVGLEFQFDTSALQLTEIVTRQGGTFALGNGATTNAADRTVAMSIANESDMFGQELISDYGTDIFVWLRFKANDGYVDGDYSITCQLIDNAERNFSYLGEGVPVYFSPGTITLSGGIDPSTLTPSITTQPQGATYTYPNNTATELSVAASVNSGELTYQWYSSTTDSNRDGTAISGETEPTYTPTLNGFGTTYYYCVVTNTYNGREFTATSDVAAVTYQQASLNGMTMTLTEDSYTYDGSEKAPTVLITGLTENTDYTLSGDLKATSAGDYTITATGKGNYTGTASAQWSIEPATIITNENPSMTIYTNGQMFEIGSDVLGIQTVNGQTARVTYELTSGSQYVSLSGSTLTPISVGTATITATITADNHSEKKVDIAVTVRDKETAVLSGLELVNQGTNKTYDGQEHALSEFVTAATYEGDGEITYTLNGVEADWTNTKITNAGTYTVVATYEDTTHYGTKSVTFTIDKATINVSGWTWNYSGPYTYDGTEKKVELSTSNTDIDKVNIEYLDNTATDVGTSSNHTASATVTVKAQYAQNYQISGTVPTQEWVLNPQSVEVGTLSLSQSTFTYDGSEKTVSVNNLPANVHADYSGDVTLTDAGSYTVTVNLKPESTNYTLTGATEQTLSWSIGKADALTLTGSASLRYDNTATQTVSADSLHDTAGDITITGVTTGNTSGILSETVLGEGGKNVTYALVSGLTADDANKTATIEITFSSRNYENSTYTLTVTVIDKNDVSDDITFENGSSTYTGQEQTYEEAAVPNTLTGSITYAYAIGTGALGTDGRPLTAGTYTVTATYEDTENYGTKTATFTIDKAPLTITGGTVTGKTYDGAATAEVTAAQFSGLVNGETLTADDYTISGAAFADANAGENKAVTFTVALSSDEDSPARNYDLTSATGAATGTITPLGITVTVGDIEAQTFTGSGLTPAVTVNATGTVGDYALVNGTDYTVTYRDNVNAGTAATVSPAANGNYTFTPVEKAFTIGKAGAPTVADTTASYRFSVSGAQTVALAGLPANAGTMSFALGTVTDGSGILSGAPTVSEDGRVTFTLAGQAAYQDGLTATIPVKVTMQNYEDVTVDLVITLINKDTPVVSAQDVAVTYTGTALTSDVIQGTASFGGEAVPGAWAWVTDPATMVNANEDGYTATVRFIPADTDRFTDATASIRVVVRKATPTGEPSYTPINSSGRTLAEAQLSIGTIQPDGGVLQWIDASGNVLADTTVVSANQAYTWEYIPADTDNYETITGSITLYVYSSRPSRPSRPSGNRHDVDVDADTDGGSVDTNVSTARPGQTVTITPTPDEGYEVDEVLVYDEDGDLIDVEYNDDGTYSFEMPNGEVSVEVIFAETEPDTPVTPPAPQQDFTDVAPHAWYAEAVDRVVELGLFRGTSDTTFSPEATTTRAMMWTVLARMDGADTTGGATWYDGAMAWAMAQGITDGTDPNGAVTREQFATMLWRYVGSPSVSLASLSIFADADDISSWAVMGMAWAAENGILTGSNGYANPGSSATRAEVATILARFVENFAA